MGRWEVDTVIPRSVFSRNRVPALGRILTSERRHTFFRRRVDGAGTGRALVSLGYGVPKPIGCGTVMERVSRVNVRRIGGTVRGGG